MDRTKRTIVSDEVTAEPNSRGWTFPSSDNILWGAWSARSVFTNDVRVSPCFTNYWPLLPIQLPAHQRQLGCWPRFDTFRGRVGSLGLDKNYVSAQKRRYTQKKTGARIRWVNHFCWSGWFIVLCYTCYIIGPLEISTTKQSQPFCSVFCRFCWGLVGSFPRIKDQLYWKTSPLNGLQVGCMKLYGSGWLMDTGNRKLRRVIKIRWSCISYWVKCVELWGTELGALNTFWYYWQTMICTNG